jgi:hypothetical protein
MRTGASAVSVNPFRDGRPLMHVSLNQAVVITFLGIGSFAYVFTQMLLATHPQILVIK